MFISDNLWYNQSRHQMSNEDQVIQTPIVQHNAYLIQLVLRSQRELQELARISRDLTEETIWYHTLHEAQEENRNKINRTARINKIFNTIECICGGIWYGTLSFYIASLIKSKYDRKI